MRWCLEVASTLFDAILLLGSDRMETDLTASSSPRLVEDSAADETCIDLHLKASDVTGFIAGEIHHGI